MMGPYLYYDSPFLDDVTTDAFHIHDCMWSGECCTCQPAARLTFANPTHHCELQAVVVQQANGKLASTSGSPSPSPPAQKVFASAIKSAANSSASATSASSTIAQASLPGPSTSSTITNSTPSVTGSLTSRNLNYSNSESNVGSISTPATHGVFGGGGGGVGSGSGAASSGIGGGSRSTNSRKSSQMSKSGNGTANNKKLRHREVEKNRHRQLQAMVKTLSEKIPGRLEKETQVQTMKRAARYCVYLRDVLNLVLLSSKAESSNANGDRPNSILKDKLENLYMRSCDNVELIMAQHMSR